MSADTLPAKHRPRHTPFSRPVFPQSKPDAETQQIQSLNRALTEGDSNLCFRCHNQEACDGDDPEPGCGFAEIPRRRRSSL